MLLAVDLDIPVTHLELLLHVLDRHDQLGLDGTPHVEVLLAAGEVARNTRPLLLPADAALQLEAAVVESAAKLRQLLIMHVEPDFVVPINARVVHPLARGKINHGT